ncbi:MAG: TolC family protein [Bacteroidales bacterium]|nr:TolC family protein [Bacteroidales bacterium]
MKFLVAPLFMACIMMPSAAYSQQTYTLQQCRDKALEDNLSLKKAQQRMDETEYLKKAAFWQMMPRITANGGYLWTQKTISLLSDEQQSRINNMGNTVQNGLNEALRENLSNLPVGGEIIAAQLANIVNSSSLSSSLNAVGQDITNGFETDTRNTTFAVATVNYPVFTGGKLYSLYRSAALINSLAGIECQKQRDETIIAVDNAFWQVVSLKLKKELAEKYDSLLTRMLSDAEAMRAAGLATNADITSIQVKLNEARLNLTKASGGLELAKMYLAQLCSIDPDSLMDVEEPVTTLQSTCTPDTIDMADATARRYEMRMLRVSDSIAGEGVRMARATLMPNVLLSGGYLVSNPNLFNGFKNEFGGTALAAVTVNIPIVHPSAYYSLKAAKARKRQVASQIEEAEQLIHLQINKVNNELALSEKKLAQALSNLELANQNLKLASESYAEGLASTSTLLAAQTAWLSARSEVLDARIELSMAKLYLQQAIGK